MGSVWGECVSSCRRQRKSVPTALLPARQCQTQPPGLALLQNYFRTLVPRDQGSPGHGKYWHYPCRGRTISSTDGALLDDTCSYLPEKAMSSPGKGRSPRRSAWHVAVRMLRHKTQKDAVHRTAGTGSQSSPAVAVGVQSRCQQPLLSHAQEQTPRACSTGLSARQRFLLLLVVSTKQSRCCCDANAELCSPPRLVPRQGDLSGA